MTGIKVDGRGSTLVLRKISSILDSFTLESPEPTLRDLAKATGLPSSTCQRLVQDLVSEGYLDRDGDRYRIGIALVRWASPGALGLDAVRLLRPLLADLRDHTGESACLYVRDGTFRTVVAVAETRHVVIRPFKVGMVMPIHAGAPGKVFLAFDPGARSELGEEATLERFTDNTPASTVELDRQLDEVRASGVAVAFGERNLDVGSVAAPVYDHTGELAVVLGVGFPTSRIGPDDVEGLVDPVVTTAHDATRELGGPLPADRPWA
ncbi:IclR family transcriptional regulator [Pseudonocardia nantongensis]|uniref:IclR family transcriptional regulator n=1 Tax=Pseudonocardia nantongensis TaxID=1181885 RepID=UPI003978FEDB